MASVVRGVHGSILSPNGYWTRILVSELNTVSLTFGKALPRDLGQV